MRKIIYTGDFVGRDVVNNSGVTWHIDIWRYFDDIASAPTGAPGELTFDGGVPVEIEWESTAKHDVIAGSVCTVNIISPGDRTYIDLYTIKAGDIGITVYRDGRIYWTGTLDPEFYEEPYESAAGYTVSLTFSDLGILDRLKYNASGMRTLQEIVDEALGRALLAPTLTVDTSMISLQRRGSIGGVVRPGHGFIVAPPEKAIAVGLSDIYARSDNFYDEDGEALSLKEVIEGILQPLALRLEQRAGKIYIYDLNGLYGSSTAEMVEWDGASQTLGVDEVKNNVTISWSPYAAVDKLLPEECWPEDVATDPQQTNMDSMEPKVVNGCDIFTYHLTQDLSIWNYYDAQAGGRKNKKYDGTDAGFTLWLRDTGRNVALNQSTVASSGLKAPRIYKIVPQYDGRESEGVALCWPGVSMVGITNSLMIQRIPVLRRYGYGGGGTFPSVGAAWYNLRSVLADQPRQYDAGLGVQAIFATKTVDLPPMEDTAAELKISMRLLLDHRFNPFESAEDFPSWALKTEEAQFNERCNYLYVPVRIVYRQRGGAEKEYVWTDMRIFDVKPRENEIVSLSQTMTGEWVDMSKQDAGDPHNLRKMSFLAYYEPDDHTEKCAGLGWKDNRQCIHNTGGRLQTSLAKSDAGQFIPYPPKEIQGAQGGTLHVEVLDSRWVICNDTWPIAEGVLTDYYNIWEQINWLLCELPQVEIVGSGVHAREIEDEDVEYKGEINPDAKDDISIDTICGTKKGGYPTARGAYFDAKGNQITQLMRAGRNGQVEDLLIGTLYSQYARRHITIEGESALSVGGVRRWHERLQGDMSFITISERADLQAGTSDRKIIELSPDEYKKKS